MEVPTADIPLSSDTHFFELKKNSKKLLIIFSATGTKPGKFNLWSLRDQIPHNILFLRVPTNDWYQSGVPGLADNHDGTIDAIKSMAAKHDITEIYTCGSSMGGWAALFYATELNCDALAFSPEILLRLPHSRSTKMMPKNAPINFVDIRLQIKESSSKFYIYTGERDPVDLYCADSVKDFENVEVITFPNDEHTVLRTLAFSNRLLPLLWSFTSGVEAPKFDDVGRALDYKEFVKNYYAGWSAYQSQDNEKAKSHLEIALNQYPAASHAQYIMGSLMYRFKDYEKGKNHILFALALYPDAPEHHVGFAHYFRRAGLFNEAIKIHTDIQKRWPNTYQSNYDLAMIYVQLGEKEQAIKQLKKVVKLQPKRQNYKDALARLQ